MNIDNAIVCVMRVGGRLTNAEMQFEAKHQALLPQQHRFTKLYVEHLHRSNLHAGPRILLALLRERIWVINARALIQLQTLFLDVEAILNSRPIAPASDDPNDIAAVTPAHLLIGTSLTSAPEAALHHHSDQPGKELRYVDRWQRVTYLKQQFWSLWQRDYVHTLQQRSKWTGEEKNLSVGQLVIIHEDNTPPQQWLLARVVATMPGKDGRVRVADVRTAKGVLRRPIHKLAPLPLD
ncbi:hypothetical protein ACLKA6_016408 [Drosophila palustris]